MGIFSKKQNTTLQKGGVHELYEIIKNLTKYGAYNRSIGPYEITLPSDLFKKMRKQMDELDGISFDPPNVLFKEPAYSSNNAIIMKAFGCMVTIKRANYKALRRHEDSGNS